MKKNIDITCILLFFSTFAFTPFIKKGQPILYNIKDENCCYSKNYRSTKKSSRP